MDKNMRPVVAELFGTFALVLLSAGAVCASRITTSTQVEVTGIALAQGLAYAALLAATLHASGGYLNPAVTITLWALRRLDHFKAVWMLAAQVLGAALAGGLLTLAFAPGVLEDAKYGAPHMTEALRSKIIDSDTKSATDPYGYRLDRVATATAFELVMSFILTFVIFGAILDPRGPKLGIPPVGFTLVALVFIGYHLTGAGINPARSFGPFLWEVTTSKGSTGNLIREQIFVYWIGPIAGAMLAGWAYTYLILPTERELHGLPDKRW